MPKSEKVINQDSLFQKAETSVLKLLEQVLSNLDSKTEKRLNEDNIQNTKKYYFKEYQHFFKYRNLFFVLLASFVFYSITKQKNDYFDYDMSFMGAGVLATIAVFIKYMYDESKSTNIFIRKLVGHFQLEDIDKKNEIISYIEKKVFFQNFFIDYRYYFLYAIVTFSVLALGYFSGNRDFIVVIVILSALLLIDIPFVNIKKVKIGKKGKKEKNGNRER